MAKKLTEKQKIGNLGEDLAYRFLVERGFSIQDRNYRKKWGEIDIISYKNRKIYFVEVKTISRENTSDISRENDEYRAEENIHPWKLKRLGRTIQSYLLEHNAEDNDWQLDALIVTTNVLKRHAKIKHIKDIVL